MRGRTRPAVRTLRGIALGVAGALIVILAHARPLFSQAPEYRPAGGEIEALVNASGLDLRILLDSAALGGPELELALLTLPGGHAGGPHRHGAVEVFYILEGELEHVVEGRSYRLLPGMVGVVRPGDEVRHVVVSEGPARVLVVWTPGGEAARLRPFFRTAPSGVGEEVRLRVGRSLGSGECE